MTRGPRPEWNSQTLAGAPQDPSGSPDVFSASREVDERTAVYLLSLARELLRKDHGAIAGMIDYAIAEIETRPDEID